jgi:signal transduction histidine kinase
MERQDRENSLRLVELVRDALETEQRKVLTLSDRISQDTSRVATDSALAQFLLRYREFETAWLTNSSGIVNAHQPPAPELLGSDQSRLPSFLAMNTATPIHISPVFISSRTGKATLTFSTRTRTGILSANYSLDSVNRQMLRIAPQPDLILTLTDQNGTWVTHPDPAKVKQRGTDPFYAQYLRQGRPTGPFVTHDVEGRRCLTIAELVPETQWLITLHHPLSAIFQPLLPLAALFTIGGLLLFLFILAPSRRIVRRSLTAIEGFVSAAGVISKGDYSELNLTPARYQEFEELRISLERMALGIREREHGMQHLNHQLNQELRLRRLEEDALRTVIESLSEPAGERFFQGVVNSLASWLQMELTMVSRLEGETIRPLAWHTLQPFAEGATGYLYPGTPCSQVLEQGYSVIQQDLSTLFPACEMAQRFALQSYVGIALRDDKGAAIGVICAMSSSPAHQLPRRTREVLEVIANRGVREVLRMREQEEQEELRRQLNQSQKMEAVGNLAGGVAHDFNNILTAIGGYTELLRTHVRSEDELAATFLSELEKAVDRASALTRQLLTFSRRQTIEPAAIDLNDALHDFRRMLERLIGEDIELLLDLGLGLPAIQADIHQIEQVILNLAVNSADALHEAHTPHARIALRTRVPDPETYPDSGHCLLLEFEDNGPGIPLEIQGRVFEPFFTTKAPGKGTGLGLATVYGIIHQNGARVELLSDPSHGGTLFRILWPMATQSIAAKIPFSGPTSQGGGRRLLLVEDEQALRDVACLMLRRLGYQVASAIDGIDALEILEQDTAFDLVLTDVIMPRMDGAQLADCIQERWPELKVVFLSGYTDDRLSGKGIEHGAENFLPKPFTLHQLELFIGKIFS